MLKRQALKIYKSFCLLWLALAACSPVRVLDTEAEEGFRLSGYKTFDFFEVDATGVELEPYTPQLDRVKQEIARQLEQRGLHQNAAAPDLKINLGVVVAEKVQTRETNILTDPPFYIGQRRYTWERRSRGAPLQGGDPIAAPGGQCPQRTGMAGRGRRRYSGKQRRKAAKTHIRGHS